MRAPLIAAALLLATVPAAANAQINITSVDPDPGYVVSDLAYYTPTSFVGGDLGASRFHLTGTGPSGAIDLYTYCADLFMPVNPGVFNFAPISTLVPDAARQTQLLSLITHTNPLLAAASGDATLLRTISAATQMAIWEVMYESQPYDTRAGDLRTVGGISAGAGWPDPEDARTLANTYLANVSAGGSWQAPVAGHKLGLLYSATNQSQLFSMPVPEPVTWAVMIGGLGVLGTAIRRRRRTIWQRYLKGLAQA